MRHLRSLLWLLIFTAAAFGQATYSGIGRIVAVGDVHGDYETFVTVLRSAGVIDKSNKWTGGATHLVQTGDCVDRWADSRKVLDLMINLERQAERSHGMVHALLGNHEAMNIYGDLRYVTAGEYDSYRSGGSIQLREHAYDVLADPPTETTRLTARSGSTNIHWGGWSTVRPSRPTANTARSWWSATPS